MGNGYAAARWLLIRENEELYGPLWVMRRDDSFDGVCLLYLKMRICNSPAAFFVIAPADGSKNSIAVFKDSGLNPRVFDTDGNFKTQWNLDGLTWSLCITPGTPQVIFIGSVGKVYKMALDGTVLGTFGKLGRLPGWFDSIHAIACPDEKTVYVANEFSYRFDKVVIDEPARSQE